MHHFWSLKPKLMFSLCLWTASAHKSTKWFFFLLPCLLSCGSPGEWIHDGFIPLLNDLIFNPFCMVLISCFYCGVRNAMGAVCDPCFVFKRVLLVVKDIDRWNFCWSTDEYITQTKSSLTKGEGMPEMPEKTVRREEERVHMVAPASSPTMFVWDLDETLIIFQTLSNGRYAELFSGFKDPWEGSVLGRRWEQLILEVCDDYFFYKQVETFVQPSVVVVQNFLLPQHLEALSICDWVWTI